MGFSRQEYRSGLPFPSPVDHVLSELSATRLYGCKTGAPSQADVDRPDPQEVLVSKEACLQFYR